VADQSEGRKGLAIAHSRRVVGNAATGPIAAKQKTWSAKSAFECHRILILIRHGSGCLGRIESKLKGETRLSSVQGVSHIGSKRKRSICAAPVEDSRAEQLCSRTYSFFCLALLCPSHHITSFPGPRITDFPKTRSRHYSKLATAIYGCLHWTGWCASMGSAFASLIGKIRPPSRGGAGNLDSRVCR
jgi:hypothetical protein